MSENAQAYFKLYTKYKSTKEKSQELLTELQIEKEYFENVIYSTQNAQTSDDLYEIEEELGISDLHEKKKKQVDLTKVNISGFEVFIGKNNRQNDYIVSKLAKDEDYWFHTKQCPGSHVLLKVLNKEPDENVIYQCAKLAKEYSSAKFPSKTGVIYTKRKYVKKPPASPLGYVIYKNETEILV